MTRVRRYVGMEVAIGVGHMQVVVSTAPAVTVEKNFYEILNAIPDLQHTSEAVRMRVENFIKMHDYSVDGRVAGFPHVLG